MNATQIALVVFILLANYLVLVPALLSTSAVPTLLLGIALIAKGVIE